MENEEGNKKTEVSEEVLDTLEKYFGFRKFLDGQEQIITEILEGRDALVVMPTGGGKSLCYQLPALLKPGITIVVSPLIALMKDQVDSLVEKKIPATMINSTLSLEEQRERMREMKEGVYKLVYIAPERFRSRSFSRSLQEIQISLFAIDEAHCLSQWGHDFRPDYLRLSQAIEALGNPQTAAFTATATSEVREDILTHLNLEEPYEAVRGFARPNLSISVSHPNNEQEKYEKIRKIILAQKTGIIYCSTRKKVNAVAEELMEWGISHVAYHGGMEDGEREVAQNLFLKKERDVVVATNAFGMGIDRSDVRFVIHFDVPGSVEAYYQEAGRAGRDGEASVCELLFNYADTQTQEFFIEGANPPLHLIYDLYELLLREANAQREVTLTIQEMTDFLGAKNSMSISSALAVLGRNHYIERFDVPGKRVRGTRVVDVNRKSSQLEIDEEALVEKEKRDRAKLKAVVNFCYSNQCRQQWILNYFGDKDGEECGNCDFCRSHERSEYREPNEEELTVVLKVLSGIARMSRRGKQGWEGRFGKGRVVQMLTGSRSQEVLNARLDELSTYGILKEYGSAYLNSLFRELSKAGLVATSEGEYPLLTLTEEGDAVMRKREVFKLCWPENKKNKKRREQKRKAEAHDERRDDIAFDRQLFEKLRKKRKEMAQSEGGIPAYRIFPDRTLTEFAWVKPTSVLQGKEIEGVGPVKAEKYLEAFIQVIRQHEK